MIHQGSREPQLVRILALVRCKSSKSGQDCRSWRSLFLPVLELFFQDFAIFCACGCGMLWHFILIWQNACFQAVQCPIASIACTEIATYRLKLSAESVQIGKKVWIRVLPLRSIESSFCGKLWISHLSPLRRLWNGVM